MEQFRVHEKKFWREFIEMYRARPVLWDPSYPSYKDRSLRIVAYEELADKLRELSEDADIVTVKKKINILKTSFRREVAKVRENPSYKSGWWCFPALAFLPTYELENSRIKYETSGDDNLVEEVADENIEYEATSTENGRIEEEEEQQQQYYDTLEDFLYEEEMCSSERNIATPPNDTPQPEVSQESLLKPGLKTADGAVPPQVRVKPRKSVIGPKPQRKRRRESCADDEISDDSNIEYLAVIWTNKLRRLTSFQRLYAEKAIHDILFEAEQGLLHRDSVKINEHRNYALSLEDEHIIKNVSANGKRP